MDNQERKQEFKTNMRILGMDFIRAVCTIGIVVFHFSCVTASDFKPFYRFANGGWGEVFVTMFFMLSGAALYYNYNSRQISLKEFYYKRWKTIFPAFYLTWFIFFIYKVITSKKLFWSGQPWKLILTMLGMDGYFSHRISGTYYLVGEWFLGAIILLYLLYPFLEKAIKKAPLFTFAVITLAYVVQLYTNIFVISSFCDLSSCLVSFVSGMLFIHYTKRFPNLMKSKFLTLAALAIGLALGIFEFPFSGNVIIRSFYRYMESISLFIVFLVVGNKIMLCKPLASVVSCICAISYPIFLVHHLLIYKIVERYNPTEPVSACLLCIVLVGVSMLCAGVVSAMVNVLLNSRAYKKIEKKLIK